MSDVPLTLAFPRGDFDTRASVHDFLNPAPSFTDGRQDCLRGLGCAWSSGWAANGPFGRPERLLGPRQTDDLSGLAFRTIANPARRDKLNTYGVCLDGDANYLGREHGSEVTMWVQSPKPDKAFELSLDFRGGTRKTWPASAFRDCRTAWDT